MIEAHAEVLIETGDPARQPASSTRFVLPFEWTKERCDAPPAALPRFVAQAHEDETAQEGYAARKRYFTPETTTVLFRRATWLRTEAWPAEWRSRTIAIGDGRSIGLQIAPPRAVLFESDGEAPGELATGFLLLDVSFVSGPAAVTLDDLLALNEGLRYWREPFAGHHEGVRRTPRGPLVNGDTALLFCNDTTTPYTGGWESILQFPVCDRDGSSWRLVSQESVDSARHWIKTADGSSGWICYTDDRAFVYSCVLTPHGAADLTGEGPEPEESGAWVRLLNVDAPSSAPVTHFERKWAAERTYHRWKHVRTLYGFNTHAAVMIGEPCTEPPTWRHFAEMYFDQVLLLLYLRVTTFRFSATLSTISSDLASARRKDTEHARRQFARLRRTFAFFTNLYRFPLLSSQQQGVEMYACARRALDVDELFKEVQQEIESTHELFELTTATSQQAASNWLGWIATFAAAAGIALTFLGLDIGKETAESLQTGIDQVFAAPRPDARWALFGFITVVLAAAAFLARNLWNRWHRRDE